MLSNRVVSHTFKNAILFDLQDEAYPNISSLIKTADLYFMHSLTEAWVPV